MLAIDECTADCALGNARSASFDDSGGTKSFGIFARDLIGRYSFGVAADSDGNVVDSGPILSAADGGAPPSDGDGTPADEGPRVTISASPLQGTSPLAVQFSGNAVSSLAIDDSRTAWDFDIEDTTLVDSTSRNTTYTYIVDPGQSKTFTARLTMVDVEGNPGSATVMIRVTGPTSGDSGGVIGETDLRIIIGVPGTVGLDVDRGRSPFSVELSIDATGLSGTLQSVVWDLGDGSRAASLIAPHTYINLTTANLVIPITATVTTVTTGGATIATSATRLITIEPGDPIVEPPLPPDFGPDGSGRAPTPCGALGLFWFWAGWIGLLCFRPYRRRQYR